MLDYIEMEILIKLGVSALLGMIIGLEREIKRKPVGLKTCLVISIVSCLLTIVSIQSAYKAESSVYGVNITMDPLRLAAQIVSGVGFLGAGVILRRGNNSISGLTTAAIIWGAAGIGIAVGAGFYFEAIAGVILLMISVEFIPFIMNLIGPKQLREKDLALELYVSDNIFIEKIIEEIEGKKFSINSIKIRDLKEGGHLIQLKIGVNFRQKITDVYQFVSSLEGVCKVEIEKLA
ncbi:MgtC/SapB family protein [Bacillus kwashiorkori]|uniref:MgtC/SapB family protein n=1 Tax=Bacillus kwashiorkori TaxID=1522318 RepID=UPI000780CC48|nr:MgtC/SapB family protein [Bacillus kwashiorkori]